MHIGMIGLGRMGMNMARRLLRAGLTVVAYNRSPDRVKEIAQEGAQGAYSLQELVEKLAPPRPIWLMLPAGKAVDEHIEKLKGMLSPGDVIVEGGNSYYQDDLRRAQELSTAQVDYVDAGVSGGIWGLSKGYCLMVGGKRKVYEFLAPVFRALAPEDGFLYCGGTGAGHFVKMVHNGIEYAMMGAYGEGFEILNASPYKSDVDFAQLAHLWNQGSVIRSWLLELAEAAFTKDRELVSMAGYVEDSGEGRWTVTQAIDTAVPAPIIACALFQRFRSRQSESFSNRLIAALRQEFGGHAVLKASESEEASKVTTDSEKP